MGLLMKFLYRSLIDFRTSFHITLIQALQTLHSGCIAMVGRPYRIMSFNIMLFLSFFVNFWNAFVGVCIEMDTKNAFIQGLILFILSITVRFLSILHARNMVQSKFDSLKFHKFNSDSLTHKTPPENFLFPEMILLNGGFFVLCAGWFLFLFLRWHKIFFRTQRPLWPNLTKTTALKRDIDETTRKYGTL